MGNKKFDSQLEIALRKMFEYVDADYDTFDFGVDGWYLSFTWTQEDQNDYADWLARKIWKEPKFRRGVARFPALCRTLEASRGVANMFILTYGWKTRYE